MSSVEEQIKRSYKSSDENQTAKSLIFG